MHKASTLAPARLRWLRVVLREGGVIAYPTETVYGLGCDPRNGEAVRRLLSIKARSWRKGLILIAADPGQLEPYVEFPPSRWAEIRASWPGPNTWVVPARAGVPRWLTGVHGGLAVRVTSHPVARALCAAWGDALVSTSANVSGRAVVRNAFGLRKQFFVKVDAVVPGRPGPHVGPSCIRDALSGTIIRSVSG